jgi:aspartyl-tRNA synthetase
MDRINIKSAKQFENQMVGLAGFVHEVRNQKSMQFVILRDTTGDIQLSVPKNGDNAKLNDIIASLSIQSSVFVKGKVHIDSFVKLGGIEILPSEITVLNTAASPLPIDMKGLTETGRDLRLDWRFLDLRDRKRQMIFKVQTTAEMAMREFWTSRSFVEIHSPKLVPNPSESGAELFGLDYFGGKAYLAQSPQIYKQMAIAAGFEKVFEIGPVFRANKSSTNRHDTEFTSVDCEFAWIDSVKDVMNFEEEWINYFLGRVKEKHGEEIKDMFGRDVIVPSLPFPCITMRQAKEIIKSLNYEVPPETKGDLDPTAERLLGKHVLEKYDHQFIFVTEFPVSIRPFYHMHAPDGLSTLSFDLLWNGIEITTGAQREHRYPVVVKQAIDKGLIQSSAIDEEGNVVDEKIPKEMKSYLDCFNYGCPPHGGYGFGLTRMLMNILGYENVREVTYIYRGVDRLYP